MHWCSIFCFLKDLTYLHKSYIFFPYSLPPVITWHEKYGYVLVTCFVYFLYSSVLEVTLHLHDINLLVGENCGILAWPILCLLEVASCPQGREELITNSFEIPSVELWLPSNWADIRFIVTDIHTLFRDNILANSSNLVPWLSGARPFHKMPIWLKHWPLPIANA